MGKIEYYKTYQIRYKILTHQADIITTTLAWPSCNDNGELIWTLCEDNCTIIPNKYIIDYKLI